jgi:single-strand DNA-binding protein
MLDSRGGGAGASSDSSDEFGSSGPAMARERRPAMAGGKNDDMDDEIPF